MRTSKRPQWMDTSLIKLIRKKRKAWKVFRLTSNDSDKKKYEQLVKTVRKNVRRAKKKFERKLASYAQANPKAFFRYLVSFSHSRGKNQKVPTAKLLF